MAVVVEVHDKLALGSRHPEQSRSSRVAILRRAEWSRAEQGM